MPAVGVHVSERAVRFIELEARKGILFVKRWGEKKLPVGVIQNGEIAKREELVSCLAALREELGTPYIHAALPEEKAYLFATEIPRVEKKEIRGAIEFLLEENVPIKPQEAIFDYELVHVPAKDNFEVSVSVLPEGVVKSYFDLYEEAGFNPLLFVVDVQAIAEAVVPVRDMRTHFVAHISEVKTTLSIVGQGVVYFTSTVAIGGETLTNIFEKELSLPKHKAEEEKRSGGLVKAKKNMELFFSLMSSLSVLRDEMNRLGGYWENFKAERPNLPDVSGIIFSGSDATMPGFVDYFSLLMKKPARCANVWANVHAVEDAIPPIPFAESLDYAAAIGLSLPKTD